MFFEIVIREFFCELASFLLFEIGNVDGIAGLLFQILNFFGC